MAPDIEARIAADFAIPQRAQATEILEYVDSDLRNFQVYAEEISRVLRCVLFLARSDLTMLAHYAKSARQDYRDVIWWAEYDGKELQIRDLNLPFDVNPA